MINDFLYAFWFFLPAGFATGVPVLAAKWPPLRDWSAPLDFDRTYRGKRILGASKTWRGLIVATTVAGLTFALQQQLAPHLGSFSVYLAAQQYMQLPLLTGCLLGLGAILGDAIESFLKRQRGIKPGQPWFPFDQIDHIIGACLLVAPVVVLPPAVYVWILVNWFGLHLLTTYLGFRFHLKERPI